MDQKAFEALMANVPAQGQPQQEQPQATPTPANNTPDPSATTEPASSGEAPAATGEPPEPDYSQPPAQEPGLGDPTSLDAVVGGALQSVFETKDFLFGNTPKDQQSSFRQNVEHTVEERSKQSLIDGFAAGVGQFATAMIGLGKFATAAKALPWVGAGLKAGIEYAPKVAESAKAALAGAIAFDPHQERISNLIQGTPLANPLNAFLAADPNDSAAEGRAKAAMESIGLDAAIIGTFLGSAKVWKYLRNGNQQAASAAVTRMQEARAAHVTESEVANGPGHGGSADAAVASGVPSEPGATPSGSSPDGVPEAGPVAGEPTSAATITPAPTGETAAQVATSEPAPSGPAGDNPTAAGDAARSGDAPSAGVDGQPAAQPEAIPGETVSGAAAKPSITSNPTDAAAASGEQLGSAQPRIRLSTEDTEKVLDGMQADADAMAKHGGWYQAIAAGHTFGKGEGVPWVKLNDPAEVDDFMARVTDVAQERLDNMKGGAVLSDKRLDKVVSQMANLFNADPANVIGMVHDAGKQAASLVAKMEAGYLVSARMMQDTYALASRIRMGDYTGFGSRDVAMEELKKRMSIAASVYGSARSITAAGGRAVRRMRSDFKLDPASVAALHEMDSEQLLNVIVDTNGDPRALAKVVTPTWWTKALDAGQFLLINNLVSGPKTQLINFLTNAYMVGARPLEKIIGSSVGAALGDGASQQVLKTALKQYTYLGTAFMDGFNFAKKAFVQNDSVLAPHRTEAYRGNQRADALIGGLKPWTNPGNLVHNALWAATTAIGLPTRSLGFVDEAVKQTVYRAHLMANAHVDGVAAGVEAGLKGDELDKFVEQYVKDKLDAGFDDLGRALDPEALREAQISTFQQELTPGSFGKWLQNGVQQHPVMRLFLPFVKTPTNVLRYGWKMTPILNMAQTEFRDALMGRLGAEAKASAAGQMVMGSLFMGAAAYLVSNGTITGGGPKDYKTLRELEATGWQPYSVVTQHADGTKTYVPYGRLDPVAIPMGIVADLTDALHTLDGEETPEIGAAISGLLIALSKQFTSKTYLTGVSQAMDAMMNPEDKMQNWVGSTVANFVPYSAAQRQLNPDPYMHEARTITDRVMATIPGFSEKVPPKRDAYGDPIRRVGLWSSDEDQLVDHETQRLILESGSSILPPQPVHNGIDLRDVTMEGTTAHPEWAGKSAFEVYQTLARQLSPRSPTLKSTVARMMQSEAYRKAPDGDIDTKGTKLWLLHNPVSKYREAAMKLLKSDRMVRDAFRAEDLKVIEHYRQEKAKGGNSPMQRLGAAFGQDLSAIGAQPQP